MKVKQITQFQNAHATNALGSHEMARKFHRVNLMFTLFFFLVFEHGSLFLICSLAPARSSVWDPLPVCLLSAYPLPLHLSLS